MSDKSAKPWSFKQVVRRWLTSDLLTDVNGISGTQVSKAAGQLITPSTAMTISAVWACVGLLSETIATLPLAVYRRGPNGRVRADDHPLHRVLHSQPNADMTAVQFWQAYLASMLLWGNGYALKLFNGQGQVIGLELWEPEWVTVRKQIDGSLEYQYNRDGKLRKATERQMFHVPALSFNGRTGISPIRAGAQVFGSAQAADSAAISTFESGLMPTVYFKMDRVLTTDQREQFRDGLKAITGALNAGKSPLLEGGMTTGTIGINPVDAQLLESRGFSIEEICRWFRVPPFMVGHSEKSTTWGSGIEQMMIGFITFGLRPWLVRIEQGISRSLLTPAEQMNHYAEYSLEGLLRGDSAARREFYASALQNGWLNRNQVAQMENQPPIPGGEIFTVQSNLVRLEDLGKTDTDANARNALINWLRSGEQA